jgi:hypothetical protein
MRGGTTETGSTRARTGPNRVSCCDQGWNPRSDAHSRWPNRQSGERQCGTLTLVGTTVYVVTAGREATYRIERIYLDQEQAQDFADRFNASQPDEFLTVENWETGAPTAVYDGPYWVARWTARMPAAKRPSECLDAPRERYGDFEITREWWTGDSVPDARVVRREIAGMPHVEVIGLSKEKVEQALYDTVVEIRETLEGIKLSRPPNP